MRTVLAAWLLAVVAAPAGVLPPGEYHYVIYADGKVAGTSSVTIARTASALTVNETVALQGETTRTTRSLDLQTFSTLSWSYANRPTDSMTIASAGATYRHEGTTTTIAPAAPEAPAALFDFFVAEYATLPAMIHATAAKRYNEYCECFSELKVDAIVIETATAARPVAVPPSDRAYALSANGKTVTLWYDPQTYVLRELDFPAQHISYVRI
jgi:hypothetical protein